VNNVRQRSNIKQIDKQGESPIHQCQHCKKTFARSDILFRHIAKYCKEKNKVTTNIEITDYEELKKQVNELKKIIGMYKEPINTQVCSNNQNNNNTNTTTGDVSIHNVQNDIKVIAFGQEDLYSIIDDNQAKKYLSKGYQAVIQLIKDLHFDRSKPKYHNVYVGDKNRPYALVYNGEGWDSRDKDDVVEQMFDDKACYLNAMYDELKETLPVKTKNKYLRFRNEFDDEIIAGLKKEIKEFLYNNRDIPKSSHDLLPKKPLRRQIK